MSIGFIYILNKCKTPTVITLKEALGERANLYTNETNFITYMARFSHYEFAEKLFDEFSLVFVDDTSILFDNANEKFHIKFLINDQSDLVNLDLFQLSEYYQLPVFTSSIAFRNKDGSYVSRVYNEVKNLNCSQHDEYMLCHIAGLREDVLSYEINKNGITFVVHFTKVSQRNTTINLEGVFSRVSRAVFVDFPDDRPNLSLNNLCNKEEIYPLLSKIKWYVIDVASSKVTSFLEKIGAEYILLPYFGEDYDYFQNLVYDSTLYPVF